MIPPSVPVPEEPPIGSSAPNHGPGAGVAGLLLAALAFFLLGVRLVGPSNLTDNDQERPASYVLDALRHGHWFVQTDWTGDIASKPPLYTWLAAGISALTGTHSLATLYLPCTLGLLGAALLAAAVTRLVAGPRAAWMAGFFVLMNPLSAKLVALARTDAVFTGMVSLTAVCAFRAWRTGLDAPVRAGRWWILAWGAAGLATLTKGPLGLWLGFAGLLAAWPERRRGTPGPVHRAHALGFLLWLGLCGGWFLLAWREAGEPLIQKMIHRELVGHALSREGPRPGLGLVVVPAYLLGRFAPWSLITVWAAVRVFRRPSASDAARMLERFCTAWLLVGLGTLGLASHQRGDLVAPLIPPAAILAALTLEAHLRLLAPMRLLTLSLVAAVVFSLGLEYQRTGRHREMWEETAGMSRLAHRFRELGGQPSALVHTDTPYALQWELGTMHLSVDWPSAATHLRQGGSHAVAATATGLPLLLRELGKDAARLRTLARWPEAGEPRVSIVGLVPPP